MRAKKVILHCWMPDGVNVCCALPKEYIKRGENVVWNIHLTTCRSCKARLRKRPQLANQIMKTRQPELPIEEPKDVDESVFTVSEQLSRAVRELWQKRKRNT